ncbi:MAG: hypothetical protein U0797_29515 [Gemmataceae bacterium]
MCRRWGRTLALACCLALGSALPADTTEVKADLTALTRASVSTDTPSLLAFIKKRTLSDETRAKVASLIEQLGADEYSAREKATADLIDLEGLGRPQVAQALKHDDPEVRKRARLVLTRIGPVADDLGLVAPAARVLAARRAAGATRVLLEYLPCAEDAAVAEDVAAALGPLALGKDDKPDPALLTALADPLAVKRWAAGQALAKAPVGRPLARKLLKDADVGVRRRVAVALFEARDKEAVPALLALLPVAAGEDLAVVEDSLLALAGDKAPERPEIDTPKAREAYHRQWASWWADHADKIDLAKVDLAAAYRGYTLVTALGPPAKAAGGIGGTVQELDPAGKVRWKIDNVSYPVHASMPRRDRVLVCEYNLNRVTERDLKGNVLWTKTVGNMIISAERLANGHTFIVTRNGIYEVDKDGREVRSVPRPTLDLLAAHRHKDGKITLLTTNGTVARLDRDGRALGSFNLGGFFSSTIGFRAHFLPNGGLVVPDYTRGKIREYDGTGRLVRELDAYRPSAVVKLPSGHYLYASRLRPSITELDKDGKEVTRRDVDGRPLFIDRR